jgi:hypothetical protein
MLSPRKLNTIILSPLWVILSSTSVIDSSSQLIFDTLNAIDNRFLYNGLSFQFDIQTDEKTEDGEAETEQTIQVNFNNTLTTVERHLEEVLYALSHYINQVMTDLVGSISCYYHKTRKDGHFPRESKQPAKQWNIRRNCA